MSKNPRTGTVNIVTICSYIFLILASLVIIVPFLWAFLSTLKSQMEMFTQPLFSFPTEFHWKNYYKAWTGNPFPTYFKNSIIVTAISVFLCLSLASLAAYAFAKLSFRGSNTIFYIFIIGLMISPQLLIIPMFSLLKNIRLLNTRVGLIFCYAAINLPLSILVLRSFYEGIPRELVDAARVDGCGKFRIFAQVLMPLAIPALTSLGLILFVLTWNEFLFALCFLQSMSKKTIPVGVYVVSSKYAVDFPVLLAGVFISVIPLIVLFLVLQKYIIRGLMIGFLKG